MKFPVAFRFAIYGHLSTPVPASVRLLISEVLICNSYSQFPNPQFLNATVYLLHFWELSGSISNNTNNTSFQLIPVI